jgi:hypothetical protein
MLTVVLGPRLASCVDKGGHVNAGLGPAPLDRCDAEPVDLVVAVHYPVPNVSAHV